MKCNIEIPDDQMALSNQCALNQFIRLATDIKFYNQYAMLMNLNLQIIKPIILNDREKSYFEKLEAKCKHPLMELIKHAHGAK